jgi:RHS repeat-associated protein
MDQLGMEILRYKYDANNRLTNRWSVAKGNTTYSYDSIGNLLGVHYPVSPAVSFAYDSLNRMTNMVDASGTTKYTYTPSGQLLTEDSPIPSDTLTNIYSNRLRVGLSLQQPSGVWTNGFAYDFTKRLTNVISPAGAFGYVYDPTLFTHHPSRISLPNTSYITNLYDGNARLTATYLKNNGNTILDSYAYIYNPANQRTNLTRVDSTVAYRYDNIGQLTVADSSVGGEDTGYSYDHAWNVSSATNSLATNSFLVNNLNELTNWTAGIAAYDSNGNMISRAISGTNIDYTYDDENRLIGVTNTFTGGMTSTYLVYDGLGRIRGRCESFQYGDFDITMICSSYVYDGFRVIQERDLFNNPTVSYTRGNDLSGSLEGAGGIGGLLARSTPAGFSGPAGHNYYFADGNGNITYMLDNGQSMVAKYRYDAFGNTVSKSGALADANVYRFSSKEFHVNSGLYYFGYRFYDPSLQRWINRDPTGEAGGLNLYEFVSNDPVSKIDPFGLSTEEQIEELRKEIELIQKMRDMANEMIENFKNCKANPCIGVSSPVAFYCNCYRLWGKNCEDFSTCVCIQIPSDRACRARAVKACNIAKQILEAYEKIKKCCPKNSKE